MGVKLDLNKKLEKNINDIYDKVGSAAKTIVDLGNAANMGWIPETDKYIAAFESNFKKIKELLQDSFNILGQIRQTAKSVKIANEELDLNEITDNIHGLNNSISEIAVFLVEPENITVDDIRRQINTIKMHIAKSLDYLKRIKRHDEELAKIYKSVEHLI